MTASRIVWEYAKLEWSKEPVTRDGQRFIATTVTFTDPQGVVKHIEETDIVKVINNLGRECWEVMGIVTNKAKFREAYGVGDIMREVPMDQTFWLRRPS